MRRPLFTRPSPSMAVALLALFVALGGTSYAAAKISSQNIRTGAVGTRAIKNGSISNGDLGAGSVGARAVKNRSLASADVRPDSLGGAAVREERLDPNKIDVRKLKAVPLALRVPKNSVGASDLGAVTRRFGGAVTVANGAVNKTDVGCKKGEIVVGGGGRWADNLPGQSIQSSFAGSNSSWAVVGSNGTGAPRRLEAFAMCLAP